MAKSNNFEVLGWRLVPVNPKVLGKLVLDNAPWVEQLVLKSSVGLQGEDLEKALNGVQRSTQTTVWHRPCVFLVSSCFSYGRMATSGFNPDATERHPMAIHRTVYSSCVSDVVVPECMSDRFI